MLGSPHFPHSRGHRAVVASIWLLASAASAAPPSNDLLILGAGDTRADGIFLVAAEWHHGSPAYDCPETGAELSRDGTSGLWTLAAPNSILYTMPGPRGVAPPSGRWDDDPRSRPPAPSVTVLSPGACISTSDMVAALGDAVASRLQDAEELSQARRPASTAAAYRSAIRLADMRCTDLVPALTALPRDLPHALRVVAEGGAHLRLGQVLRAIPSHHPLATSAPAEAVTVLRIAAQRLRQSADAGEGTGVQLSYTQLVLGHTHLTLPGRAHALAAVTAFRAAAASDRHSISAAASSGRALVLLARRHQQVGSRESNSSLEAAIGAFSTQLRLLHEQRVPLTQRRDDVFSENRPLWWADMHMHMHMHM